MKIVKYIKAFVLGLVALSCTVDDAIVVDDHFLDYEIEEVPVETDYTVGAHYSRFEWSSSVTETPALGRYDAEVGNPSVYAEHVNQAQAAGVDYFLFTLNTQNDTTAHPNDVAFINNLLSASNAGEMNFAITYNFGSMELDPNNSIESLGLVETFLKDFADMLPYFQRSNYMQIDGKAVVFMNNSHNLFSEDNVALYQSLRNQMSDLGVNMYIIGEQNEWTPPLRYDFRFVGAVDALTHVTYANINQNYYDRRNFFHRFTDQAWTYHQEKMNENNLDYIPTISPSYDGTILNPNSNSFIIEKNQEWFKNHANVARKTTNEKNLVLIDSFNDWNRGTQIEASESYNSEFIDLVRQEFTTN